MDCNKQKLAGMTLDMLKNAVKDALNAAIILGGGSVDIRTEEEILNDNLTEAFPDGESNFEKLFMVELIDGIDAVYKAVNEKGFVFVVGEQFIGVNADGTVVTAGVENETLFTDAGYRSRTTAWRHFTAIVGCTPSEFVERHTSTKNDQLDTLIV